LKPSLAVNVQRLVINDIYAHEYADASYHQIQVFLKDLHQAHLEAKQECSFD
jgi:hypothetical protein